MKLLTLVVIVLIIIFQDCIFIWKIKNTNNNYEHLWYHTYCLDNIILKGMNITPKQYYHCNKISWENMNQANYV